MLCLDGQELSSHGYRVQEFTRLSPTIYPIIFAAITGRFFRNLARYLVELPGGVRLAALEQIFGSQSFAGAFERLFFVRTQVVIGAAIFAIWALSPLGGQSASRLLEGKPQYSRSTGTIYYMHPAFQKSKYYRPSDVGRLGVNANALYSACFTSSEDQRRSPRDLWGFPRIPQWQKNRTMGELYEVDVDALDAGDAFFASLLGTKMQGLNFATGTYWYNFTLETAYHDFDCKVVNTAIPPEDVSSYLRNDFNVSQIFNDSAADDRSFSVSFSQPRDMNISSFLSSGDVHLLYLSKTLDRPSPDATWNFALFDCLWNFVIMETEMLCSNDVESTACRPYQQRRIDKPQTAEYWIRNVGSPPMTNFLKWWPIANGIVDVQTSSPTDRYLAGDAYPFATLDLLDWTDVDATNFSRRLTTAYNTYWDSTLDPLSHTNTSLSSTVAPNALNVSTNLDYTTFMNSTAAREETNRMLFHANRGWVIILLITTVILQIISILGVLLRWVVQGPDVLGYVSTMTRDNSYVPLPVGGSALDGPDRARMLGGLRVQLADTAPGKEQGYIALAAVPARDGSAVARIQRNRVYR